MPETSEPERAAAEVARLQADPNARSRPDESPTVVIDDLTIEDVSIDGMCGVY